MRRSPAPGRQSAQGKAGSLAGAWHVAAGTRQAGWLGGLRRHAGPDLTLPGTRALETWRTCALQGPGWGPAAPHVRALSRGQASVSAGSRAPVVSVADGGSVPLAVSDAAQAEACVRQTRGWRPAGLRRHQVPSIEQGACGHRPRGDV